MSSYWQFIRSICSMQGCFTAKCVTLFQMYIITLTPATAVWSSCSLCLSHCSVRSYTPTVASLLLQAVFLRERRPSWSTPGPRSLRHWYVVAHLLVLWVRIPPGLMDVCLFVLCVFRKSSLRRANHSSRILPTVKYFT